MTDPATNRTVTELLPNPGVERRLEGLHLAHDVRANATASPSFVYSGFISSLDGRIGAEGSVGAPRSLRNDRDWRLFQELIVQADVVLVSGRYVRDVGRGLAHNIIPVPDDPLNDFRRDRGLPDRPAVGIVTRSGGFEPGIAAQLSDRVMVIHGGLADFATVRSWSDVGLDAIDAGIDGAVDAGRLIAALIGRGLGVVFSAAGPGILAMLTPALDALYLTLGAQLLGGKDFMTLLEGDALVPSLGFTLESAYLDRHGPGGAAQLFLEFRTVRSDVG